MSAFFDDASGHAPESVLERLSATCPGLEVWWDSSPLVYTRWVDQMVAAVPEPARPSLAAQLHRLYDPGNAGAMFFRGVTTNPPLSLAAMQADPLRWSAWIRDWLAANPGASTETAFWALYKETIRLGAEAIRPLYEASGFLYGHISGQVDPRCFFDAPAMLAQALELSALAPNVMIKVPGSPAGIGVIRELTSRGVSTNCTAAYMLPQFEAVAQAVLAGLEQARRDGVDLTGWRSVVTDMSVRWENSPAFDASAEQAGVSLTPDDRRWAGVSVFKRAYWHFCRQAYPSKLLICSVRMGPAVEGRACIRHLEETAGANAIFTLPPGLLTELFTQAPDLSFTARIWEDIPADVHARLLRIPYYTTAIDPGGLAAADFDQIAPLQATCREFSAATEKMVAFVAERMAEQQVPA